MIKSKISNRFYYSLLLISTLLLSLSSGIFLYQNFKTESEQSEHEASIIQLNLSQSIGAYFSKRMAEMAIYSRNPSVSSMKYSEFINYLQSEQQNNSNNYEKFIVGTPEGYFYNTSGHNMFFAGLRTSNDKSTDANRLSIAKRDYWKRTVGNNQNNKSVLYISNPMISYTTGAKQIVVASSIIQDSVVKGMIGGAIKWERFSEILKELKKDSISKSKKKVEVVLISPDGTYWDHWDKDKIIKYYKDPISNKFVIGVEGNKKAKSFSVLDDKKSDFYKQYQDKETFGKFKKISDKGKKFDLSFVKIPGTGYVLGMKTELDQPFVGDNYYIYTVLILFILAIFIISILAKKLTKKLDQNISILDSLTKGHGEKSSLIAKKIDFLDVEFRPYAMALIDNLSMLKKKENDLQVLSEILEIKVNDRTAELNIQRERAELANQAKTTFLSNMSHELRTPLNAVIGHTQLLERTDNHSEMKTYAGLITESSLSLLEVINDILDISKIEYEGLSITEEKFSLVEVLDKLENIYSSLCQKKGISFKYSNSASNISNLIGDKIKIKQVITNLIGNAIKFTDEGIVSLEIDSQQNNDKSIVEIIIRDTGIGMGKESLEKIFNPFSQADETVTRNFGGTGLGLTICKKIIEKMNGTITVESEEGEGSVFTVSIEFLCAAPQNLSIAKSSFVDFDDLSTKYEHEILVVEDNQVNQKLMKVFLKKFGYSCDIADNGKDALEKMKDKKYSLVFMDLQMPVMDGITATKEIIKIYHREERPRIIALTANAFNEDRAECFAVGMDGFLSKPVSIAELRRVLISDNDDQEGLVS
jgi:signal transduction histidine kinase/CheY-like chemotaxis protein